MHFTKLITLIVAITLSSLTFAHHSDAGIDKSSVISLEGKVTEFRWRQPHVYIAVEVMQDNKPVIWNIQLGGINSIGRQGWSADSLKPGDEIALRVNPAADGRHYGTMSSIQRADGSPVAVRPQSVAASDAKATSLAGQWLADRNRSGPSYPGGYDGFFSEQLVLTDAARAAAAVYDPLSSENPEATCVGRPIPAALVSTSGYLMEFDLSHAEQYISIHSEWFDEMRTVYMDGRDHPAPPATFQTGHSVGHWEGDTLVIDTRNFEFHRSPYQIGVPSSVEKHVVEKYRLIEDGAAMQMEFTLEDPVYLAEPFYHSRVLLYSPQMEFLTGKCDLENTSQFLR